MIAPGHTGPDQPQVFVSYSHTDGDFVRVLASRLEEVGVASWIDANRDATEDHWTLGLSAGDDFPSRITDAIRGCDLFVVVLSPASNGSRWVAIELALAHHFQKGIVPIVVSEPEKISAELLPYLVRVHRQQFKEQPGFWPAFVDEVKRRVVRPPGHAATPVAAHSQGARPGVVFVSNALYAEFLRRTSRSASHERFAKALLREPAVGITWRDALAYCYDVGGRLPTERDFPTAAAGEGEAQQEWCDGGTVDAKQVRESATGLVRGLYDPNHAVPGVRFRCLPVEPDPPREWALVAKGDYPLGFGLGRLRPLLEEHHISTADVTRLQRRHRRVMRVPGFEIAKTPVTNAEFQEFVRQAPRHRPCHWDAGDAPFPAYARSLPVVNVSADAARMYCIWARVHLPYWYEWELAASSGTGADYPWGETYDPARCNSVESGRGGLVSVFEYPTGDSGAGLRQMAGNAWEIVNGDTPGTYELRGGSFRSLCRVWGLASAFRTIRSNESDDGTGFRVIRWRE